MSTIPTAIGRFQIRSRIGQGGMGALYLAWDPTLEREIAIKLLRDDSDELRERFAREARSVARLRHRHIVMIFDVGEHEGRPFIAMEYIRGQTLAQIVRTAVPLTVVRKLQLVEQLCDGLAFAHKAGIVHRDIKPANLMVDEEGSLKILDFGIARVGPGMTQAGMLIGTLNYMSPEQVMGKTVDGRSDIFAVGGVLYELLAYRQAFSGGLESGILNKILHEQPEPLETVCRGLDSEVIQIVNRALQKDPRARYQELVAMRNDLAHIRQGMQGSKPIEEEHDASTLATTAAIEPTPTPKTPRREPDREALARRRAAQIEAYLEAAGKALAAGDYERAIAGCEEVLLLDGDNARASELLDRARVAVDERQASEWIDEAQRHLDREELTEALDLVQKALAFNAGSSRGAALLQAVEKARQQRERARERIEAGRRALARAGELFDQGAFEEAVAAADEALAIDPADRDALSVKQRGIQALERKRREALNQRAKQTVAEARSAFQAGQHEAAMKLLADFGVSHPDVTRALEELRSEVEALRREEERRREAERRAEIEALERKRREALNLRARQTVAEARGAFQAGQHEAAIKLLVDFDVPHPDVMRALEELRSELETRRREEERRREAERRAEAERQERERQLQAALSQAKASLARRDFTAALKTLRPLQQQEPDAPQLKQLIAEAEAQQAEAERARRIAGEIRNHLDAALARFAAHDLDDALTRVEAALALDAAHQEARALATRIQNAIRVAAAQREAEARRQRERDQAIADAMTRASSASSHEVAIAAMREVLALDPDHQPARHLLKQRQTALDREQAITAAFHRAATAPSTEAAVAALRQVLDLDPDHQEARRQLQEREADLARKQAEARRARERQEAISAAIRSASSAPSHEAALAALRSALDLDPHHPEARRLFEARDAALKQEQALERRRREIETACREIETQITSGAFDAAERTIAAFEREADAKKAMKPFRRRLQQARAAADKARDAEISQLVRAARQALAGRDFSSARERCARVLVLAPQSAEARALAREIEQAAAAARTAEPVARVSREADAKLAATSRAPAGSPEAAAIPVARPHAGGANAAPSHAASKDWRAYIPPGRLQRVAIYIGAAVTLVVVLAAGYRALQREAAPVSTESPTLTSTESPPPQTAAPTEQNAPVPPPPAASQEREAAPADQRAGVEQQVSSLRLLARQQFARGERQEALATALAGLELQPQDNELQGVLADLSREASASVQRARAAATAAGSASSAPYREAIAKQQEGDRLARSARPAESLRLHWDAADLFARAAEQGKIAAKSAPQSPPVPVQTVPPSSGAKPGTASPANEPQVRTLAPAPPQPPSVQAPVPAPPQPPPPQPPSVQAPVPAPPQQPPAQPPSRPAPSLSEEDAVLSTLRAYEQAYSTLNLDAVTRVFPSVNAMALGQAFAQMRAQRVQIVNEQVSITGTTATVTCQVRQRFEPRVGRATETTVNAIFRLQKLGSAWFIVERQ